MTDEDAEWASWIAELDRERMDREAIPKLTVLEAHSAADCPDRRTCWAADIHNKYDPEVPDA